jgi:small subunit ribosomal protein S9
MLAVPYRLCQAAARRTTVSTSAAFSSSSSFLSSSSTSSASNWSKVPVLGEKLDNGVSVHGEWRKAYGTGRRKTAVARVWLRPGDGNVSINKTDLATYFDRKSHRENVVEPFAATKSIGKWDVKATVGGGGKTGQAQAIRHGIALALRNAHPKRYTKPLRNKKLTTRDPRMVERKKPGQPKARKKFQWVKR